MTRILVMTTLPLADVKARLSAVVDDVEGTHERVVITRNGRPAAVILAVDDLAALEETLDILGDSATMQAIREAEAETPELVDPATLRHEIGQARGWTA